MKHQARPLGFVTLPTGCFVCTSHKHNADGYFRKGWGNRRTGDHIFEMFHRFIWRAVNGPIPEGFEVNHKCNNRACCNPKHLEAIDGGDHAALSNSLRYAPPSTWKAH